MKKAQRKQAKAGRQTGKMARPAPKKAAAKARAVAVRAKARPSAARAATRQPGADLAPQLQALQARVQELEDIMEISRLKAAYCEAVDGGWDRRTHRGEAVAALFVEDGVWDAGKLGGRGEGHQGIIDRINSFQPIPFALHRVTNPDIRINGDEAIGKWHVIAYLTQPDGTPTMFMGTYRDRFVRTPQGWKFKSLGGNAAYFANQREGWGVGEYYKQNPLSDSRNSEPVSQPE
jgi:hypothetical protein